MATLHTMRVPLLHCLEPTQHTWVLDPNYIKAQVVMIRKATRLPP